MSDEELPELLRRLGARVDPGRPPPTARMVAAVEARRRGRRRIALSAAAAAVVALVGLGAIVNGWPSGLTAGGDSDSAADRADEAGGFDAAAEGEALTADAAELVGLDQVGLQLPAGWRLRSEPCGPHPDAVEVATTAGCGPAGAGVEQVVLRGDVAAPASADGDEDGDGDEADGPDAESAGSCAAVCASVYFEEQEVVVTATAPSVRRAERLLRRVGVVDSGLVAVPPYLGRSSTADGYVSRLRGLGLRARVAGAVDPQAGPVAKVRPGAGVFVPAGSTVRVWVRDLAP